MIVYLDDVRSLLRQAIAKFETDSGREQGDPTIQEFFADLVVVINKKSKASLSHETFYKSYWLKVRSHTSPIVGFSMKYLDAISNFVHDTPYLKKYRRVKDSDDESPEYPVSRPKFPATSTIKVRHSRFKDLWIKDESQNECGVHKDRLSHEVILMYQKILRERFVKQRSVVIPRLSMITSGYAGLSLQYQLRKYGLPDLKVLVDPRTPEDVKKYLENSRAEVYEYDLSQKQLYPEDILKETNNYGGLELTYGDEIRLILDQMYDWLSFELLALNPDMIICPFGSGGLFRNILRVHNRELETKQNSIRYFGIKKLLAKCHFIAAYPQDKIDNSQLWFLHSPFSVIKENELPDLISTDMVGGLSNKYGVVEDSRGREKMDVALRIAIDHGAKTCPSGIAGLSLLLQKEDQWREQLRKEYNEELYDMRIVVVNTGTIRNELFENKL